MYNLSPRFLKQNLSSTPPTVCSNTYNICGEKDWNLKNRTPFLSSSDRKFSIGGKVYSQALYNPEERKGQTIKGGASLNYTAVRLKPGSSETPAPGTYDPKKPQKGFKVAPPPCHGNGRLYVCRVPYTIYASAPTIPTHPNDENGYDLSVYNDLIKVPPDQRDYSRGPASYNVPVGEFCYTSKRYKGCHWSKSNTKRYKTQMLNTPGPDAYDVSVVKICKPNEKDEEYRGFARLMSFIPRYTESQIMKAQKQDIPGPGYYNVMTSTIDCRPSMSINPRPLVTGAKRFKTYLNSNPAPGRYDPTNCDKEKRYFSTKDVPFGNQALRFPEKKGERTPGPQTYNLKGPIEEKMRSKFNKYSVVDVPFFTTAERPTIKSAQGSQIPGPDSYDVGRKELERELIHASVFKSRTSRFQHRCPSEDADPASYNITESFNKNRCRTSCYAGKAAFLTSAKRLEGSRDDKPGPADYLGQTGLELKGLSFGHDLRFKCKTVDTPPPGQYTIHPAYDLSIYRAVGTHNLRLKENVLRTKLRHHPRETFDTWASDLKKNKKLQCFEKRSSIPAH